MRHGRLALLLGLLCAPAAHAAGENDRYALAQGCYDLTTGGQTVASHLRLKPPALGQYLLYTKSGKFLTGGYGEAAAPSEAVVWTVEGTSGAFALTVGGK